MPANPLATPLGQTANAARPYTQGCSSAGTYGATNMQAQRAKRARGEPSGLTAWAQRGFTLAELLVVLTVLGILLGIGIPSFRSLLEQNRATSAANQLQASLQFARSTAIAQGRPVTICVANFATNPVSCNANSNNWHEGWIVRLDNHPTLTPEERVLREQRPLNPSIAIITHPTGVRQWVYSSTGNLLPGQALENFSITVSSNPGAARTICMSLSGSSRVIQGGASC